MSDKLTVSEAKRTGKGMVNYRHYFYFEVRAADQPRCSAHPGDVRQGTSARSTPALIVVDRRSAFRCPGSLPRCHIRLSSDIPRDANDPSPVVDIRRMRSLRRNFPGYFLSSRRTEWRLYSVRRDVFRWHVRWSGRRCRPGVMAAGEAKRSSLVEH
jgi:hypothetical protein